MLFARWALSVSALGVIGAFGATLLNSSGDPAIARVIRVARRASFGLILACVLTIAAQLNNWFGAAGFTDPANVWTMLSITLWGLHWTWLAGVAIATALLFIVAARRPGLWIYLSGVAAVAVALTAPLIGHGGTHDAWVAILHRAHLLGAGLWMGTLMVALASGFSDPPRLLLSLRRFAPIALTGALLIAASGLTLAWLHLQPLSTLWTSEYGQVLLAKLAAVLIVASLGFVNWRGPRLKIVVAEVTIAILVVLSLTALLSEGQMPGGH